LHLFVTETPESGSRPERSTVDNFVRAAHRFRYAGECRVQRGPDGKPALLSSEGDPLRRRCSISHTHNWLACVFAEKAPVGVDVEFARPRNYLATGTWFFGAELGERLADATPESQRQLFYQAWTAYEALYKCGVNKRREMAPLLTGATQNDASNIALRWLLGPQELLACVAVLSDTEASMAVTVYRQDGAGFTTDPRWSDAPIIRPGGDSS